MRSRAREIAAWIVGALVALAVLAWLYDRAAAMPEPLQVDELSRVVRKLASDAREAERLATALTRSQLTRTFAEHQHRQLEEDVSEARGKLAAPGPGGDEALVEQARGLADRLRANLAAARLHASDHAAIARIGAEQASIAAALERMPITPL
ncbi:MAG TPA: hypothetical protein VFJ86_16110 [Usitatibacter sp.]|nr:hypothetical protein [Usitatibacter sp.]